MNAERGSDNNIMYTKRRQGKRFDTKLEATLIA